MSGSAVSTAVATTSTVTEIPLIAIFGVSFALVVLIFTTTSWAEPFIVLIGLGIAVVINAGSNIVFGEISFVTNAAGSILQLAVSLDYSIFLLHRFEECRKTASSLKDAMIEALNSSAIGAVFIVLLFTMKSLTLPVLLVLGIETAIWINLAIPYFTDTNIFYIAYLIISSIQLGATVDYAILFTDRYMEYRKINDKKTTVKKVITTCTVSVMTSASVLCVVGFLLGMISTHGLLAQLGMLLGKGTLCSLIIVMFVLPGMLYLLDGVICKTTMKADFFDKEKIK